ncbi:MAG: hypothetical protein WBW92_14030 [Rhodanobacteraceae bacterium]
MIRHVSRNPGWRWMIAGVLAALAIALLLFSSATQAQIISGHPRMILDNATLATLRQRANANTTQWQALKGYCDSVVGGTIQQPNNNSWASPPNIGSNYQGHGYINAVMNLGLCYRTMQGINATSANVYGNKLAQVLSIISQPYPGPNGANPCTDSGYGIRNYGVALGIGFDWGYDRLQSSLKTQIIAAANHWLTSFENPSTSSCSYYQYIHPLSNYYAGYFHAKTTIALGTFGDNAAAASEWNELIGHEFGDRVRPYFADHMEGGGWPEGFANYGPYATLAMILPAREILTATGIDLTNPDDGSTPYRYPLDMPRYAMHFTWPSRDYTDDRDTNRSSGNTVQPPGTADTGMFTHLYGSLAFYGSPLAPVMHRYLSEVRQATSGYGDERLWVDFLFDQPNALEAPLSTLPRSYLAQGLGMVAARSDWGTDASWMSFRSGPYVESPDHGEQYPDQGSLALVHGGTPLLINASGWIVHEPGGTDDENRIYTDNRGSFSSGNVYSGNSQLYNVFYVRHMSGSSLAEPFGQRSYNTGTPRTALSEYQDGGGWVYSKGSHIEDMYKTFSAGPGVASWSREVLFLRPNRFIVYDRTRKGASSYDQYLAFHFPAMPSSASAATGQKRVNVTYNGRFAGSATFVYPDNPTLATLAMYPGSNPVKAWQVQVRPSDSNVTQRWLSVFNTASTVGAVGSTSRVNVISGTVLGVRLDDNATTPAVVLATTTDQDTPLNSSFSYSVPAAFTSHIILGVAANSGWTVSVNRVGSTQTFTISPGGTLKASHAGVLSFVADARTTVRPGDTLLFDGFDS